MPTSIDPQPAENEVECANCGAYFYMELTRCPECGVSVFGEEEFQDEVVEKDAAEAGGTGKTSFFSALQRFILGD